MDKNSTLVFTLCVISCAVCNSLLVVGDDDHVPFDENYVVTWGESHVTYLEQATRVQLSMDKSSGAGFASKRSYGSGDFRMRIKVPARDSAGVVSAFYLASANDGDKQHGELDLEFLGNRQGKPITLQTNVFADSVGGREQRTLLWFDPMADFHDYRILWNQHQVVFFVDDVPIRVYKNNGSMGVAYPSRAMFVNVSLYNGENWVTDGGREKINWTMAPFVAEFGGFDIIACSVVAANSKACNSPDYSWNAQKFWSLDRVQEGQLKSVREKYMNYDYCTDKSRFPTPPPECSYNI